MTYRQEERSAVVRVLFITAILGLALLLPGRLLQAEGPVLADDTLLVEIPVPWVPGQSNLYIPFDAPAVGSRTPGSVITANFQDAWPANAQAGLEAAIVILENMIVAEQPIVIEAHWDNLGGATLGTGGPYYRSFTSGVPFPNTWMPGVLVNELSGSDVMTVTTSNPVGAELKLTMNSGWGSWHYGPGPAPAGKVDFTTVALHELLHGLGFTGSMKQSTSTTAFWGIMGTVSGNPVYRPAIYDQFTQRGSGSPSKLIDMVAPNIPDTALMTALKGGASGVRFTGPNAVAANGGNGVLLYTPSAFEPGSSYSHLAQTFNGGVNTLMTYAIDGNETVHEPGPVARAMLKDFGYTLQDPPATPSVIQFDQYEDHVAEGGPARVLSVRRVGGMSGTVSASCVTTGGSATEGVDYVWQETELVWLDGEAGLRYCAFVAVNDPHVDPDETVVIGLADVTGATIGTPFSATVTIRDLLPAQLNLFPALTNGVQNVPLPNQPVVDIRDSNGQLTNSNATVTLELVPPPGIQAPGQAAVPAERRPLAGKDSLLPEIASVATPTEDWAVWLIPGTDAPSLASSLGAGYVGPVQAIPDVHIFRFSGKAELRNPAVVSVLESSTPVRQYEQQMIMPRESRAMPSDPGVPRQWHLKNTGQLGRLPGTDVNVEPAWDAGFTGAGVVVGVVDDSLQFTHPDIAPNYSAGLSYDYVPDVANSGFPNDGEPGPDSDPSPTSSDNHGTAVAGLIGAAANNGVCGVGVAYEATLAGIRGGGYPVTDAVEAALVAHSPQDIQVYNNSWGPRDNGVTLGAIGSLTLAAIQDAISSGREGLGNIFIWAAGNGRSNHDNSNFDGYANLRQVIAVAAIDGDGRYTPYSEPGANLLISAPGGTNSGDIHTTDRTGTTGYSNGDCTSTFNGTSAAAPIAAGAIALMLEANPNLTWRDVQHILVQTATKVDPFDFDWAVNGAGHDINHNYGFGLLDTAAAVAMAESWTNVGPEITASSGLQEVAEVVPDGNPTGISRQVTMTGKLKIEHVELVFSASHGWRGDLEVTLTSPSGTVSELAASRPFDAADDFVNWPFTSTRHWDESMEGTWTINVRDVDNLFTGGWSRFRLNFYGTGDAHAAPELVCDGGLSKQAVNGVATFSGCVITQPGDGYRVRATSANLPSVESSVFNVTNPGYDATCDGVVGADDALAVLRTIAGLANEIVAPCTGNASGDRGLQLADALLIRRIVAGLP